MPSQGIRVGSTLLPLVQMDKLSQPGHTIPTIRLWDTSLESWKSLACEIVNRNLTSAEWDRFFQDTPYHNTC